MVLLGVEGCFGLGFVKGIGEVVVACIVEKFGFDMLRVFGGGLYCLCEVGGLGCMRVDLFVVVWWE